VEYLWAHSEQLLDRHGAEREQQRFPQSTVVRRHRPCRPGCLEAEAEPEVGDVGGLAVAMGARRLQVCALDQPHVNPGGRQDVDVALGTQQGGLHRCADPVCQAAAGDVEYAAQDRVGAGGVLRADLDTPTRRQHFGDRRQPVSGAGRIGVDRQVGQVQRQPHVSGRDGKRGGQGQVVLSNPIGGRLIPHKLAEQVDADPVTLRKQVERRDQRFIPGTPGDIARRRPPRLSVPARRRLDDPLETLTRRQPEQHRTVNSHDTTLACDRRLHRRRILQRYPAPTTDTTSHPTSVERVFESSRARHGRPPPGEVQEMGGVPLIRVPAVRS